MVWTPPLPNGIAMCQSGRVKNHLIEEEESTVNITTIGLDIAKNVFQVHGIDKNGKAVLRKKLNRNQVLAFFANLSPCLVGLEACAGIPTIGQGNS
jgi:ABC-type proline/glycine betaine transport system ATPase subunit